MLNKNLKMLDVHRVMRHKLIFQKPINESPIEDFDSYKDFIKVRGEINYKKSKQLSQSSGAETKRYRVFRVRYRTDLDETMRIIYKNEPYEIESIIPLNDENIYLEITAYQYKHDIELAE